MCEEIIKKACDEIDEKADEIKEELKIEIKKKYHGDVFRAINETLRAAKHPELKKFTLWYITTRSFIILSDEKEPLYYMAFDPDWKCIHFSTPRYNSIGRF